MSWNGRCSEAAWEKFPLYPTKNLHFDKTEVHVNGEQHSSPASLQQEGHQQL